MSDPDVCIFCGATGCLNGTAAHTNECPFVCGIWPVTEEDVRRETVCASCKEPFVLGDSCAQVADMSHPAVTGIIELAEAMNANEITFTVCVPCAALGSEIAE